jgi:hypothetical protein
MVGYLAGALHRKLVARDRQASQAHMMALDDELADETRGALVAAPGIDVQEYVGALRATGRAADLRLARDIEAWLGGATQQELGDAAYRRMLRHLRGPRSRAIGHRAREWVTRAADGGVMAPQEWCCTTGTRIDSVVHRANARLIQ